MPRSTTNRLPTAPRPPRAGTGKTLLARAVANRTDACFIRVIGSELVQKYVGEVSRAGGWERS
jgi:ATP-dependent Zn protease